MVSGRFERRRDRPPRNAFFGSVPLQNLRRRHRLRPRLSQTIFGAIGIKVGSTAAKFPIASAKSRAKEASLKAAEDNQGRAEVTVEAK